VPNKLVIANTQKRKILEGGRDFLNTLEKRLYVTAMVLSGTVMPTAVTDEPDDGGYVVKTNPFPNVAVTDGTQGSAVGAADTWTFLHDSGDQTIVGVFFTDPNDADVTVMAQKGEADFVITAAGQVYVVSGPFFLNAIP
jgi:hypothetical protein